MRTSLFAGLACSLVAAAGFAAPAADAATGQYLTVNGSICKPAGTTTNTQFITKATGARNESTTASIFVICPFTLSPVPADGGVVTEIDVALYTLDGVARSIPCTAVIGSLSRFVPATYSAKTFNVAGTSAGSVGTWNASDFGGIAGAGIPGSAWATITCNLPPQTAISLVYGKYNPLVGN